MATIKAGNPSTLLAPFNVDRVAQTEAGLVLFEIESGTPIVDYQPWGYGGWGDGGDWGEWEPKMLRLRSATGDIVTVDPTDYLSPTKGAIALRIVRYVDTGSDEFFLESGGDPDDWLRLYVRSDDKLVLSWASAGSLPQEVESVQTIEPNTLYFVSCEWQHTYMALRIGNGEKVTGTRGVPVGSWGAGPLLLKAGT